MILAFRTQDSNGVLGNQTGEKGVSKMTVWQTHREKNDVIKS